MTNHETDAKPRVRVLDFLRGLAVINMVAFHAIYDAVWVFMLINPSWYIGRVGYLWQQSICWIFILVSGAALNYGKRTRRGGIIVLGCALFLSFVTGMLGQGLAVKFGILHMLGCSFLIFDLLRPFFTKIKNKFAACLYFFLFAFFKTLPLGYVGFLDIPIFKMPNWLYETNFLYMLGLPSNTFESSDYFPLLPWFFLFLTGYYVWSILKEKVRLSSAGKNPIEFFGRNSLLVYMIHQPIIYLVLYLVSN